MGNYSRNTYDPNKRYTSVRLQQGVPLVDADWNEQADILRHQTSDSFNFALGSGVPLNSYGYGMSLSGSGLTNDFNFAIAGKVMFEGRLVTLPGQIKYSAQPWTQALTASAAGVPVIPPLTTPVGERIDCVYLDVWEREVSSVEDPNLVNDVIGVETAVRTKLEVAVRVNQGSIWPDNELPGHTHMRVAILQRTDGNATIGTYNPSTLNGPVLDARPVLPIGATEGILTVPPVFFPIQGVTPWVNPNNKRLHAYKPSNSGARGGVVLHFPDSAHISQITYKGITSSVTSVELVRVSLLLDPSDPLGSETLFSQFEFIGLNDPTPYFSSWALDYFDPKFRVDNFHFLYILYVGASGAAPAAIHRIWFDYQL